MNNAKLMEQLDRAVEHVQPAPPSLPAIAALARKRRSRARATAAIGAIAFGGLLWAAWSSAGLTSDARPQPATHESSKPSLAPASAIPGGVTADGRTYGPATTSGDSPDLIATLVDGDGNGVRDDAVAFADVRDLKEPSPSSPEQALRWQTETSGYITLLYATDGTSIVATFATGDPRDDAMAVVALASPPGASTRVVTGDITLDGDCPYIEAPDGRHWLILPWGWHLTANQAGYDGADGRRVTNFRAAQLTVNVFPGQQSSICPTGNPPYYVKQAG